VPRTQINTVGDAEDYDLRLQFWHKHDKVFTRQEVLFAVDLDFMICQQGIDTSARQSIALALMEIVTRRKAKRAAGQRAIFFLHAYILGDQGSRRVSDLVQGCLWLRRTGMSRAQIFSVLALLIETTKP
jgi:hypothetical protein